MVRPCASSARNVSQSAHFGTRLELASSTRGASSWVRNTPTARPDWINSVSSSPSRRSSRWMIAKSSHERAALPVPP